MDRFGGAAPPLPDPTESRLVLQRSSAVLQNRARRITVRVDGKVLARLRNGQRVEVAIVPGCHTVEARLDPWHRVETDIVMSGGQTLTVLIGPRKPLPAVALDLLRGRFSPSQYLSLEVRSDRRLPGGWS